MSNIYEFPAQERRYDEASLWIARLDNGLSQEQEIQFCEWLSADPDNQALLLEMARLWDKMGVLTRLSDLFPKTDNHISGSKWSHLAIAATVLLVVAAGAWIASSYDLATISGGQQRVTASPGSISSPLAPTLVSDSVYETAIGEQSTVILSDGTQVILNTNSLIEVKYSEHRRLLTMVRGEIHVEVAEDKLRPLVVLAGENVVQAVGTAFSLEITTDRKVELVVTEGKVLVGVHSISSSSTPETFPFILPPSSVTVAAGEEYVLGSANEEIVAVSSEEIEVKLSWREGNLIFRGESLEEAVTEIGRYTTVQFVIADEDLKRKTIGGRFRAGDVDGLLAALRENFSIAYERTDDGKILLTSL